MESYIMKRPDAKVAGGHMAAGQASDEVFSRKYPNITLYLTDDKYEDGGVRELSALSVSVREGNMLVALNDKDLKQSMYTQADTLTEALKLMEGALAGGQAEWRPWKSGKKK